MEGGGGEKVRVWGGGAARWGLVSEGGREGKRLALDEMSSIVIKQEFPLSL